MGLLLLLTDVLLMGVTLLSLFFHCRLQSRIYRTMKMGVPVDVRQNGGKLFLYDGIALVSWWLASLTGSSADTVSAVLLPLLEALLKMLIFFLLSGICIYYMIQYSKKR